MSSSLTILVLLSVVLLHCSHALRCYQGEMNKLKVSYFNKVECQFGENFCASVYGHEGSENSYEKGCAVGCQRAGCFTDGETLDYFNAGATVCCCNDKDYCNGGVKTSVALIPALFTAAIALLLKTA